MPFQKVVNSYQAPAVAGDFASTNPNASMLAGEGALVAGDSGVTVGVFAWADADGKVSNKKATNGCKRILFLGCIRSAFGKI